ncbi:MAG: sugar phosphate isomerase/epimerase [Deltaproteobacteria bacterium]|nr:sugar phosphate isomerase/epimerase [Deltaproteobacteria bacterium]
MTAKMMSSRSFAIVIVALFAVALCPGLQSAFAADKAVQLGKYPNLKIGFTSQNLVKWLPHNVVNLKTIIDFASKEGFAFIELRDPNADLSYDDARQVAAYAKQKKVEVIYAMGVGGLDANYFEAFSRGLANAMLFNGPRIVRTGANGKEMAADPGKQFWTAAEFDRLVGNLNKAANTAKTFGYTLYVENANEGLKGDGAGTFGTADLFGPKGVNANVGFQLDMANFFCVSRVVSPPEAVKAFFEANVKKVGYSHLKTSINRKPQTTLNENELPFATYFSALSKEGKVYVAIELANPNTLEEAYANHLKSVDYLKANF